MRLICLKTNWFESYMRFRTRAAVFEKSGDTPNDLKHADMKIK